MAKFQGSNELSKLLFDCHNKHGYRVEQYLDWFLDDVLADLTQRRKANPPPQEVIPTLFDLGQAYAKEVGMAEPFSDMLGQTYMDIVNIGGQKMLGQYFTPAAVAKMMNQLTYQKNESDKLFTVCDPACGSGVMLLTFAQVVAECEGLAGLENYSFTGVDLDPICAKMFAAQMLANVFIHQIEVGEIAVLQGNSLGLPSELKSVLHVSHNKHRVAPINHPKRLEGIRQAAEEKHFSADDQLEMFA